MDPGETTNAPRSLATIIRIEQIISVVLLVLVLGLVVLQMVSRYLFEPYTWTVELSGFGLVWLTFIGAALVMAQGRHITIDLFNQLLGPRGRMALDIVSYLITMVTAVLLLPAGFQFTVMMNHINAPASRLPMSVLYTAAVSGFSLLALHCLIRLIIILWQGSASYAEVSGGKHEASGDSS